MGFGKRSVISGWLVSVTLLLLNLSTIYRKRHVWINSTLKHIGLDIKFYFSFYALILWKNSNERSPGTQSH